MQSTTQDMTHGSPWRLIVSFAVPVLLSQVFQQLYNTADTLIVGRFLGDGALAAVSSSGPLIFLLISFFVGVTMGASVTISRYFGAGDHDRVSRAIHTNILVSMCSGILLTVCGVAFTPTILRWMGTDPEVLSEAISYFRYYFTGVLAVVLYNACKSIMNALGDSRRPLYYLILSSLINIALDLLFIAIFHWGVWSAAVATTISQAISMVLCLIHLSKKGMPYQLQWRKLRFDREMLGQMVRYGLPSGVQNSVIGLANVILQSNINSFGKLAMAGYGAYSKLEGFAFLPITSFTMALTTYTGQNLGAMQYDRAKKGARFGILVSITLAELIGVGMYVFAPQLISIFTPTPEVIALGTQQARTIALFYCLLAYSHAVASVCRGAGKAFVPMTIMLATWCALRIVYITTIMHIVHEIQYIYWAYPLTWSVSSVIYFIYYHRSDWIHGFDDQQRGIFRLMKPFFRRNTLCIARKNGVQQAEKTRCLGMLTVFR